MNDQTANYGQQSGHRLVGNGMGCGQRWSVGHSNGYQINGYLNVKVRQAIGNPFAIALQTTDLVQNWQSLKTSLILSLILSTN